MGVGRALCWPAWLSGSYCFEVVGAAGAAAGAAVGAAVGAAMGAAAGAAMRAVNVAPAAVALVVAAALIFITAAHSREESKFGRKVKWYNTSVSLC